MAYPHFTLATAKTMADAGTFLRSRRFGTLVETFVEQLLAPLIES